MNGLARSGAPNRSKNQEECNIIRGLTKAVELLGQNWMSDISGLHEHLSGLNNKDSFICKSGRS